jgi:hypothetical protein
LRGKKLSEKWGEISENYHSFEFFKDLLVRGKLVNFLLGAVTLEGEIFNLFLN